MPAYTYQIRIRTSDYKAYRVLLDSDTDAPATPMIQTGSGEEIFDWKTIQECIGELPLSTAPKGTKCQLVRKEGGGPTEFTVGVLGSCTHKGANLVCKLRVTSNLKDIVILAKCTSPNDI